MTTMPFRTEDSPFLLINYQIYSNSATACFILVPYVIRGTKNHLIKTTKTFCQSHSTQLNIHLLHFVIRNQFH